MRRKVSETAIPPSNAPPLNAAALTQLDDPTFRETIARVALSGPGAATLREAQAALQPGHPKHAEKLNGLIVALEVLTKALSDGAVWAKIGAFVYVDGRDITPMFGTLRIGDKATVYWRECGEVLSHFVARDDGLSALAMLVARLARPIEERHLIAVTDRAESITLVRQPARVTVATLSELSELSELEAVAVDGEPFVTKGPDAGLLAHYRARPRAAQRGLPFAGPRRMDQHLIGSPVVRALQSFPLIGDERSPIRGDTLRVAALGYASTGAMLIDEPTGALLFGANTAANRKRFWEASRVYHHLELTDSKTGRYVTLGHAPADGRMVSLGAPFWWHGQGEGHRWSLTGRLLGPRFDNNRGSGGAAGFQSGLTRTLAGLESALSYSRSAGKGKHGRTPDLLRQVRKGGAGPDTFIPWRALLSLAGEPVPADAKSESVWGRRYRRRVDALIAAGYLIPAPGGVAPAGDTVEIVRVVDGRGHGHVAGVRIRASARFCAAHADNIPTRLSAARLFDGSG